MFAGYSHINKLKFSAVESSTMVKYFYHFSGVNPYSINQTTYCETLLEQRDLYVINNIHTIPYEKPDSEKDIQEYHIQYKREKNNNDEYFTEVFLKDEYFQNHCSVPIYIKRAAENIFDKSIWFPQNKYYLIVTDKKDRKIYESNL